MVANPPTMSTEPEKSSVLVVDDNDVNCTLLRRRLEGAGYRVTLAHDGREAFGRYLDDQIVSRLLETQEGLALGGEKRRVSVLMSDLRGFTSMAERLAPEKVVAVINNYLTVMTDVIMQCGGTIDEFIGDA